MGKKKSNWSAILAVTTLFVAVFFGLRAIPVSECAFLHYEPVETALQNGGEEELCSIAPKPFVDVVRAPHPVSLRIHSQEQTGDGETEIVVSVLGPDGRPLLPHELAITHSRRLHFMLINDSLDSYHHLHPEPLGDSGDYRVRFRPQSDRYRYFAEFVPLRTRLQSVADGILEVKGSNSPQIDTSDSINFALEGIETPLRPNRDHTLRLRLKNRKNGALPLEKTMDAYAHLVGFEETLSGFAHMHPLTVDPEIDRDTEMEFVFHPTRTGNFRIWVQIRADGEDIFRPFDVQVL